MADRANENIDASDAGCGPFAILVAAIAFFSGLDLLLLLVVGAVHLAKALFA